MTWTPDQDREARSKLSKGRVLACKKAPFLADMIYALIPVPTDELPEGVGTAVTKDGIMLYSPEVVSTWTIEDSAVGVIHESEHLRRDHYSRRKARDPERWNIAADAEINDDIVAMGFKLLPTDITPQNIGSVIGKTAEFYYKSAKIDHRGCCGSGAGNALKNEKKIRALQALHLKPAERQAKIESAVALTESKIKEHHNARPGSVPGGVLRSVDIKVSQSEIPWERKLEAAVRRATAWRTGFVDTTYTKINRKQAGMGFGIGKPILAAYVEPVPLIALVQDTSASMQRTQIEKTLEEAEHILRACGGSLIFLSCDTKVHEISHVDSVKSMASLVKGGGGTDFRPAFQTLQNLRIRPDIVIFSTDAFGIFPEQHPSWCSVIWLLSTPWAALKPGQTPWGTRIEVGPSEKKYR